jgi:predicted MFS family arabinose efflux permease
MTANRRQRLLGPVLVLTAMVTSIVSSLGAPLLLTVSRHFDVSLSTAQWSLTVTLLAGAVSSPVLGRLGDGRRRRETMIGAMAIVTAGGLIAALAPNFGILVIGRCMQGVGLGLVPLAMATARDELPAPKVPQMIALLSVAAAAGIGIGYPITGLLAQAWGLRGAYWFGAIACALALLAIAAVIPSTAGRTKSPRLDWLGSAVLAAALVAVLLGIAEGSDWGWGSSRIIALLLGGVALFGLWAVQQLHADSPLVELRLLRHPAVLAGDVCAVVLGLAMYMDLSGVVEFVQIPRSEGFGFSASPLLAGVVLLPLSALMMAGSRLLPTLVRWLGTRTVLAIGCLITAGSAVFFALLHDSLWEAFAMMGLLGVGLGTTFAAIPSLIVQAVPATETGSAMGFYQVVRYVGFSAGSALTASAVAAHDTPQGAPTVGGYTLALWISVAICVIAAALAYVLPARDRTTAPTEQLPEDELRQLEQTEGEDYLAIRSQLRA